MGIVGISDEVRALSDTAHADSLEQFALIDETARANAEKVLAAYQKHKVSEACFAGSTGYGYDDKGRDTLDAVFADVMGSGSALVRAGFLNGTHAIASALFAALRPGDRLLSATGLPYDTIQGAIGITGGHRGSLKEYGVKYSQVELRGDGRCDIGALADALCASDVSAVFVQRSRGYSERRALPVAEIGEICEAVRSIRPGAPVIVDNCYGEFTETIEPGDAGADIVAGSLIKNPGGGLAPAGGYVAGRADLIEAAANRLAAPGIGAGAGAAPGGHRLLFQGLFMAPHTVAQAMKTAVFCSRLFELMGYETSPGYREHRSDIIQSVELGSRRLLELFCRGIQAGSPVDAYVTPEAWDMPGYDCPVIMAAGTFVQGASIELSADGPMREPYRVYLQGGLSYESGRLGIMTAASMLGASD
ncbi:MAG: methionine gamma-lyase family protein [Oscillospiraceae bacterium]|nr:methionine gamma-lyase family protein [Oscillospiraceae bacterium]